nr:MAG TPA: hypothetical protein [Bacteriophage sp.]DAN96544.1 MAG TPA: hypothetical protein [Caudoviricetes sp.]
MVFHLLLYGQTPFRCRPKAAALYNRHRNVLQIDQNNR